MVGRNIPNAIRATPEVQQCWYVTGDADFVLVNSFYRFHLLRTQALARLGDVEGAEAALRTAAAERILGLPRG